MLSAQAAHTQFAPTPTLWLVRHARVVPPGGQSGPASAHCHGHTNWPADPAHTQEAALAVVNALEAFRATRSAAGDAKAPLHLRCSTLLRCEQLSQSIQSLRPDWTIEWDARLTELHFGAWEGLPWDDVPRAELDAWAADFSGHRLGGHGETVHSFVQRVALAAHSAFRAGPPNQRDSPQTQPAVWVTHAGVMRAMRWLEQRGWPVDPPPPQAHGWPADAPAPGGWCTVIPPSR